MFAKSTKFLIFSCMIAIFFTENASAILSDDGRNILVRFVDSSHPTKYYDTFCPSHDGSKFTFAGTYDNSGIYSGSYIIKYVRPNTMTDNSFYATLDTCLNNNWKFKESSSQPARVTTKILNWPEDTMYIWAYQVNFIYLTANDIKREYDEKIRIRDELLRQKREREEMLRKYNSITPEQRLEQERAHDADFARAMAESKADFARNAAISAKNIAMANAALGLSDEIPHLMTIDPIVDIHVLPKKDGVRMQPPCKLRGSSQSGLSFKFMNTDTQVFATVCCPVDTVIDNVPQSSCYIPTIGKKAVIDSIDDSSNVWLYHMDSTSTSTKKK